MASNSSKGQTLVELVLILTAIGSLGLATGIHLLKAGAEIKVQHFSKEMRSK